MEKRARPGASDPGPAETGAPGQGDPQGWVSCAACGQYFLHEPEARDGETATCSLCGEDVVIGFLVRGSRMRTRWSREACDGTTLAAGARRAANRSRKRGAGGRLRVRLGMRSTRPTPAMITWTLLFLAVLTLAGVWLSSADDSGRLTPFDAAFDVLADFGLGSRVPSPR